MFSAYATCAEEDRHTGTKTDGRTDGRTNGLTYHATDAGHVTGVVVMNRQVLHERVLARLTAVDRETNYHKHRSL